MIGGKKDKLIDDILSRNAEKRIAERLTHTNKISCPTGQIVRKGYIKKSYKIGSKCKTGKCYIPTKIMGATCIPNRGLPGKGFFSKSSGNILKKMGYFNIKDKSASERRNILINIVNIHGLTYVNRALSILKNSMLRTSPSVSKKIDRDIIFLQKKIKL